MRYNKVKTKNENAISNYTSEIMVDMFIIKNNNQSKNDDID